MKKLLKPFFGMMMLGLALLFTQAPQAAAQTIPDVSTIKVDELSDSQVRQLLQRASNAGISKNELVQMARQRGMPETEVEKLQERINELEGGPATSKSQSTYSKREPRSQMNLNEIMQGVLTNQEDLEEEDTYKKYFGLELFYQKERKLTFEPSLNIATPKSYIVGPGDLLYVDVYGESERYYESTITAEGQLILESIGPINVSGMSIEEASKVIKNRLSQFYTDIRGENPSTFVQVTLGNVRSIKVHLVGEVRLPGTFTLSSFSTVFNALYAAGGPNTNGTMRNIKVIRNNKQVATVDAYAFLVKGKANMGFQLQDQDVILVEPFEERVTLLGAVKRPLIFETKAGETFADVLAYAGGFTDDAFVDRVSVTRNTEKEKVVADIYRDQFGVFTVKGGDHYQVGQILNRYLNRVQIKGAVFREGNYALVEGLTLADLIKKAEGLRGEAYLQRASILRTHEDLSTEVIQVNLSKVMEGEENVTLQRDDIVRIASIYDLKEEFYVKISGEVQDPGIFPFSENMKVEDLMVFAGGLKESASIQDIEIARRLPDQGSGEISDLIPAQVNEDLSLREGSIALKPFDHVIVRKKPNFTLEKVVQVEGQVNAPGEFAVKDAEERISDVIRRAGGLTQFAYPQGATLIRRTEYYQTESERIRRQKNLARLLERLVAQSEDPSEAEASLRERLDRNRQLEQVTTEEEGERIVTQSRAETLQEITSDQASSTPIKIKETEAIAINLDKILQEPRSKFDLILEEGDIIRIPKQLQTVRMRGDVIYPTTVRYENNRSIKYYIDRAGGFDDRAKRKRTYVVYANGEVARTKNFLFINFYPKIEPGAEVIVPSKGPRTPLRAGELLGLTSGLATLVLIVTQINANAQ